MDEKKNIIITGGAKGIGFACAQKFYENGHCVVIADSNANAESAVLERLQVKDNRAIFVTCDVSDSLSVRNLIAQSIDAFSHIDVLVNNAGKLLKGGVLDMHIDEFEKVMAVNVRGTFLMTQAVAHHMIEANAQQTSLRPDRMMRSIINISSINAIVSAPNLAAYSASKAAINQLTKTMALELAPYNISANAVGVGNVRTDMFDALVDVSLQADIAAKTPFKRFALPDEIANVVCFLASDAASYITGQCINVDGGSLCVNTTLYNKPTALKADEINTDSDTNNSTSPPAHFG